MHRFLFLAVILVMSGTNLGAHAATVYKCADGQGKIGFSDRPCDLSTKALKTISVNEPVQDPEHLAREARRKSNLDADNQAFKQRQQWRDRVDAYEQSKRNWAADQRKNAMAKKEATGQGLASARRGRR